MTLPQIQTEIFRQLVGMETLLKDDYAIEIIKHVNGAFSGRLFKKSGGRYLRDFWIETEVITTADQIPAEIHRIWHAIMPTSSHWMTNSQIAFSLLLFIISATGYTVCWISLNNKI